MHGARYVTYWACPLCERSLCTVCIPPFKVPNKTHDICPTCDEKLVTGNHRETERIVCAMRKTSRKVDTLRQRIDDLHPSPYDGAIRLVREAIEKGAVTAC